MKFIINDEGAPDIPEELLQKHEDGKVIFFCGAGISYDAGLPGFKKLVENIYFNLGCTYNQFQKEAMNNNQFDLAITLLEKEYVYDKNKIKKEIYELLASPKVNNDTVTLHKALLELSMTKDNKIRLVTTNFDRIFELLKDDYIFNSYVAPALPIVNNDWNGLVYLHGLLNEANTNPIVISSGDFGQAYLIDRWASRFMGQLLKEYSVCFVGYSLNDPILRYMTDAIDASKKYGEPYPEIFAFCDYNKRGKLTKKEYIANKWKAKGVIPIPYNKKRKHSLLKKTFSAWADSYSKGFQGKVQEVIKLSGLKPSTNTNENDIVKKMIWALCDSTGKAMEAFAENNPVFDLSWLYAFDETKYKGNDLSIFGISCQNSDEEYSIINRPVAEKKKGPIQSVVSNGYQFDYSDNIFEGIYKWLLRHLNNLDLILWICKKGGMININLKSKILSQLNKFDKWETDINEKNISEKRKYLFDNPNGIPNQEMRILWNLVLTDRLSIFRDYLSLIIYSDNFKIYGINNSNKYNLLKALMPIVKIQISSKKNKLLDILNKEDSIFENLDLSIEYNLNVSHWLSTMDEVDNWKLSLQNCILDFTLLLKEYNELNFKLGKIKLDDDYSYIDINDFNDIDLKHIYYTNSYIILIYLLVNSWISLNNQNPKYANDILKIWWNYPYPIFKRLTFFAISKQKTIDFDFVYSCLCETNSKWLWIDNTRNETFSLLKKIAKDCEKNNINLIVDLLLNVNFSFIYPEIEDKDKLEEINIINLFTRLDTIKKENPNSLSKKALKKYKEIQEKYSFSNNDTTSFEKPFHQISEKENLYEIISLPKNKNELFEYIKQNQERDWFHTRDDWKDLCKNEIDLVFDVLLYLYKENITSYDWWNDAFNNCREESLAHKSWNILSNESVIFNEEIIAICSRNMSDWLNNLSFLEFNNEDNFLRLINLIISKYTTKNEIIEDYVSSAINNPIGICVETLQKWWFSKNPTNNSLINEKLLDLYTEICKSDNAKFISGKVILASNLLFLYQVDPNWTKENLTPLFDWEKDEIVSNAVWQGFLWNPRGNINLINDIKEVLIQTVIHKEKLSRYKDQYIRLICSIGVYNKDLINKENLQKVIYLFDEEELIVIIDYLSNLLKNTKDNLELLWDEKIYPFIQNFFPKSLSVVTSDLSQRIALLCINSDKIFYKVFDKMQFYLIPIKYPDFIILQFNKKTLIKRFPKECLLFIYKLIDKKNPLYKSQYLRDFLHQIIESDSTLKNLLQYRELIIYT